MLKKVECISGEIICPECGKRLICKRWEYGGEVLEDELVRFWGPDECWVRDFCEHRDICEEDPQPCLAEVGIFECRNCGSRSISVIPEPGW